MEAIRPRPELRDAFAREEYQRRYPKGRPAAPAPANVAPVLALLGSGDPFVIPFRGRGYELGYVSFEDGLRLTRAKAAVEALDEAEPTEENTEAYLRAIRLIVGIAPRYLVPIGRVRRFFWRLGLRRNPFRSATDAEVGHLLGFFLASQTRSRVRFSAPTEKVAEPTS